MRFDIQMLEDSIISMEESGELSLDELFDIEEETTDLFRKVNATNEREMFPLLTGIQEDVERLLNLYVDEGNEYDNTPIGEREYLCYWGHSQYDGDHVDRSLTRLKFGYFDTETGWSTSERKTIASLELDECMNYLGSLYDILVIRTK